MTFSDSLNLSITSATDYVTKQLNNEYVSTVLIVLAILYGSLAAPKLPVSAVKVVKHPVFLLLAITLVAYLASKNVSVALMTGLVLCITLISVSNYDSLRKFMTKEKFDETTPETTTEAPVTEAPVTETPTVVEARVEVPTEAPVVTMVPEETTMPPTTTMAPILPEIVQIPVTEAPKMVVTDQNGEMVKTTTGEVVVAPPTVAVDETGAVVVDENKEPIMVAPKVAVDETGEVAKDREGKVIVVPPVVEKDVNGMVKKDKEGRVMVNSCMVSVDGGNSVRMLYGTRGRKALGGRGIYDDYNMMFDTSDKPTDNKLSQVCVGSDCLDGYEPNCLAPLS
jgi:hypothetical protein